MEIPLRCLITVEMGKESDVGKAVLASNLPLDAPKHIFLMLFMLTDRRNPSSFFKVRRCFSYRSPSVPLEPVVCSDHGAPLPSLHMALCRSALPKPLYISRTGPPFSLLSLRCLPLTFPSPVFPLIALLRYPSLLLVEHADLLDG